MVNLDTLLNLPGAMAAFTFTDRGELGDFKIKGDNGLNEDILDLLSHVCIANLSISTMQARGWEQVTGMKGFYPTEGFTMIGMDWSTVMHGSTAVVVDNDEADYRAIYDSLEQG